MVYRLPDSSLWKTSSTACRLLASVVTIDMSEVIDDKYGDYINDLPRLSRSTSGRRDLSVCPSSNGLDSAPAPGRSRLFVSNFNRNSYNVRPHHGPYGMSTTTELSVRTTSMVFSPDETPWYSVTTPAKSTTT